MGDPRVWSAAENLLRIVTTSHERSKLRYARRTYTGTVRSFPTYSPSQWRSRTATLSPKICELEMKTRPKKAKKYSYTKDCKEQPREICDQCEKKSLKPVCVTQDR